MPWNVCWLSGKCLRGVWGLCEWLWIQGGGYDVQSIDKHQILLLYISGFLFSQLPWNGQNVPYFRVSKRCLGGVWGCLSDSRYCLGGYDVQAIDKHPIWLIFIGLFLFSQLPQIAISCGVCRVSGRCLGVVWLTLNAIWGVMVWFHLIKIQFGSF